MCGRYTVTTPAELVAEVFALAAVPELAPRYNVAPTQEAPVVRRTGGGRRRLDLVRWGLVPTWADDPSIGNRLINARGESAATRPAYRLAWRRHRCLVVADGFFEWRSESGRRQPYWIHPPDGRPIAFAGLWSRWHDAAGERLDSFAIVTRDATAELTALHDRMPAILDPDDWTAWLDPGTDPAALPDLIGRATGGRLDLRRVSRRVNRPEHDDPDCLAAMPEPPEAAVTPGPGEAQGR